MRVFLTVALTPPAPRGRTLAIVARRVRRQEHESFKEKHNEQIL
ncbi:hypothetical protein [uncultured Actinomyces sp.]|nr:hypothetical protein [uncultured Actinomyces sp.]